MKRGPVPPNPVETVSERAVRIRAFTSGFDYLRLILASAVVCQHSYLSSYGDVASGALWGSWPRIFLAPVLLMFFALSGFLVSGSLKKNPTATSFATLRAIRLLPALSVEIALSAIIIGPLVTTYPLQQYFADHELYHYLLNIIGRIHYRLPGVFASLPFPYVVNISLWTLPSELECYIALILMYKLGFIKNRMWLMALVGVAIMIGTLSGLWTYDPYWVTTRPLPRALVLAFFCGVVINLYADRIRLDLRWVLVALIAMCLANLQYETVYLAAAPAAYITVYLGMMNPRRYSILFSGDYSYGLYLFAFPIQQLITFETGGARNWVSNVTLALVLGLGYAAFSWWCVEKPLLARKKHFVAMVEGFRDRLFTWFPHPRWVSGQK